jgi:ABC-2 type transport system permease protein
MSVKTALALISKEIKQIKRDASSILVAFVMPLIVLSVFGFGVSFNIEDIGLDVVKQDSGKISCDLVDLYTSSKYFKTNVVHSIHEAEKDIESGTSQGALVLPPDFSKKIATGKKPTIQIISDGIDPNTASYIEGYTLGIFSKYMSSLKSKAGNPRNSPTLNISNRLWFNTSTETINFLMAGVLTLVLSIVGTFLTSLVVAKEWERGTMEAIIATPVSIWEIIISKVIPYFILSVISFVFSILCGMYVFNVPFEGGLCATTLVTTVFIVVLLLMGLLISTSAKDQFVAAMGAMAATFLPTFMLSGLLFEIKSMPTWLQCLTTVFPAKYYVSSIRTLCMTGDVWEIILRDTGVLTGMAFFLTILLKKKLKKNVE